MTRPTCFLAAMLLLASAGFLVAQDDDFDFSVPPERIADCDSCDGFGCDEGCDACGADACGPSTCRPGGVILIPCPSLSSVLDKSWIRAEYLLWWANGMDIPPLVTTTTAGQPDLANPFTQILYGNQTILDDARSGGRVRFGTWLDRGCRFGVEGEYFALGRESTQFSASSDAGGSPIIGRPFFNINPRDLAGNPDPPAREFAQLVSSPGILAGSVRVDSESSLSSAGVRAIYNVCCGQLICRDPCSHTTGRCGSKRFDLLLGYRYLRLSEGLTITEDLNDLAPPAPFTSITDFITDDFSTENDFNGVELGGIWTIERGIFSLEMLGKVAVGNTRQVVTINGSTVRTVDGTPTSFSGGLLAQSTNMGRHSRDVFSTVPELGVTGGIQLTQTLRLTFGYSFVYWSRVVRPGDQIDLDVNPDYIPPAASPITGPARPGFEYRESDLWVQGFNFGLDARW